MKNDEILRNVGAVIYKPQVSLKLQLIAVCTFGEQFAMNSEISYRHFSGSVTELFHAYSFQTLDEQNCEYQELF